MAEKADSNNGKIIAIIVGVVLVIAAAIATVVIVNNNNNKNNGGNQGSSKEVLNDDFFKTTDTKIVISTASNATDSSVAKKVHQVYTVDGDKITGVKVYSEFDSEESAKAAEAKPEVEENMKAGNYANHKVDGNYLIVTMPESMYQSVTATDIRAAAAAMDQAAQSGASEQTQTQTQTQTTESYIEE